MQTPLIKNLTAIHIWGYKNIAKQHTLISEFSIMQGISQKFMWNGYDGTANKTEVMLRCNRKVFSYLCYASLGEI